MYTIVDGITTMNTPFDILVIGQRGVGKTALLRKYVMGASEPEFDSSECLVYKSVKISCQCGKSGSISSEATNKQISILDSSAGVDTLLTQNSYQVRNAKTIVFAYSASSSESLEALEYTVNCIESVRDTLPPCVVVSIKSDFGFADQVSYSQGAELAQSCGALSFVEARLHDDSTVERVFSPLVDVVLKGGKKCSVCLDPEDLERVKAVKNEDTDVTGEGNSENYGTPLLDPSERASFRSDTTRSRGGSDPSVHQDMTTKFSSELKDFTRESSRNTIKSRRSNSRSLNNTGMDGKAKDGCCVIV